jgi:hypothetical protein
MLLAFSFSLRKRGEKSEIFPFIVHKKQRENLGNVPKKEKNIKRGLIPINLLLQNAEKPVIMMIHYYG